MRTTGDADLSAFLHRFFAGSIVSEHVFFSKLNIVFREKLFHFCTVVAGRGGVDNDDVSIL